MIAGDSRLTTNSNHYDIVAVANCYYLRLLLSSVIMNCLIIVRYIITVVHASNICALNSTSTAESRTRATTAIPQTAWIATDKHGANADKVSDKKEKHP
jgi:hypothetical protein